jgi:hypothetical protein
MSDNIPTSAGPRDPGGLTPYGTEANPVGANPFHFRIVGVGWGGGWAVISIRDTGTNLAQITFGFLIKGTPIDPNAPAVERPQIGAPGSQQSDPAGYPSFYSTEPDAFWNGGSPGPYGVPLRDFSKFYSFFEAGKSSGSGTQVGFLEPHGHGGMAFFVNVPKLVKDFKLKSLTIEVSVFQSPGFMYTSFFGYSLTKGGATKFVIAQEGIGGGPDVRDGQDINVTGSSAGVAGSFTYPPAPPPAP